MSNENERRSMDDVMASIRRIIRSERAVEPETDKEPFATEAEVVEDVANATTEETEPYSLTDEMRVEEDTSTPDTEITDTVPVPEPASEGEITTADPKGAEQAAVSLDESAIEDMIRRVLREELMGEIGQNISANVTRMIETEVTRRLPGPK